MKSGRVFVVFFFSLVAFMLFLFLATYNLFYKNSSKILNELQFKRLKSGITATYMTSKYDLQNVIRDDTYQPVSSVYLYDKKSETLSLFKGTKPNDNKSDEYLRENVRDIIYLEDGFGYLVPFIYNGSIYIYVAIEKGDNIYISLYHYANEDKLIKFCIFSVPENVKYSQHFCRDKNYREIFSQKFFDVRYMYENHINIKLILLFTILFLIIGAFLSYWVSRHFDLEEKRILSEIQDSIDGVEKGKIPLITVKSMYQSYNLLIGQINNLINKMSTEIDKHRVVYNAHFKDEEQRIAIRESSEVILKFLTKDFSVNEYQDLLKSFDFLLAENGGGVKYKGISENLDIVRKLVFVMMEILKTRKDYHLIVEADKDKIMIISENRDFEQDKEQFVLNECKNIIIEEHKITIS